LPWIFQHADRVNKQSQGDKPDAVENSINRSGGRVKFAANRQSQVNGELKGLSQCGEGKAGVNNRAKNRQYCYF
jgi:hypothetical protein